MVSKSSTTTTIATVYKTLAVLKFTGEVLELEFSDDSNRYDGKSTDPHPHLMCIKCKRVVDPDFTSLAEMTEKLALQTCYKLQEATRLSGEDPDHATRDLYEAIERGDYPSWTLEIRILTTEQARDFKRDILDITKVWPHAEVPPIKIGKLVLNRNPVNYFAEVNRQHFVPAVWCPESAFHRTRCPGKGFFLS